MKEEIPQEVFIIVEEMPTFPGGESALMKFIYDNIQYPQAAKDKGTSGKVTLRFAVMADGTVSQTTVLRGVDPDLDNEAMRVIKMLPAWKPGKQGGKPVNVWYSVPVIFQLK
jgi:protein TonB